ncbi:3-hydroxy-9,10-secoandrosta-1,3,5(10)-triene-9,17-dione monooxygenase reductase subunit [Spongisporangium articulatum]|uniref:3-hydroxy-9,10-secoandrosta-1,3,5(10)-triene-9, 17-dione monooxygenase reductase subunit n=1 Tax=Spongisporangium articulatum TaxID=3362603 RepID=A0ABW8ATN0_9ACTN
MQPVVGRAVSSGTFREVLGHFCTGVTVITARDGDELAGFACQAFAAVSLDPPLVLFCPTRGSRTWPAIERAGRFVANVLAWDQAEVSARFGRGGPDKFEGVGWTPSPGGAPVLTDALTWVEADVESVTEAGDHYVVLARVARLGGAGDRRPLLFHRGRYTSTEVAPAGPEPWFSWSHPDDWI